VHLFVLVLFWQERSSTFTWRSCHVSTCGASAMSLGMLCVTFFHDTGVLSLEFKGCRLKIMIFEFVMSQVISTLQVIKSGHFLL